MNAGIIAKQMLILFLMMHIRKGLYPGKAPRAFRLQLSTFLIRV